MNDADRGFVEMLWFSAVVVAIAVGAVIGFLLSR